MLHVGPLDDALVDSVGLDLQEPWVNDAVVIGGASAVLSPIIQWGHTILQSKPQVHHADSRKLLLSTITKVTRSTVAEPIYLL